MVYSDIPPSSGDVVGPSSATDTAIALYDGTTGKLIKNSVVTISGAGAISGASFATTSVVDSGFTIVDDGDATKILKFQCSGITTGTTRTLTAPDANTTIVGTDATQTLTNKTLTSPTIDGGTITLSTDTNFVLSGGVNGVSFDTNVLSIDATNDRVGINTAAPTKSLDVVGTLGVSGNVNLDANVTIGDASGDTVTVNSATWTFANDTAVTLSGGVNGLNFGSNTLSLDSANTRVGIGTAAPAKTLDIVGNVSITTGGDHIDYIRSTFNTFRNGIGTANGFNGFHFQDNATSAISFSVAQAGVTGALLVGASEVIVNEGGSAALDFRAEGDTNANLLFVDASADKVGVGLSTPAARLHVEVASGVGEVLTLSQLQSANTQGAYISFLAGVAGTTSRGFIGYGHTGSGPDTIFTGELANVFGIRSQNALQIGTNGDNVRMTIDTAGLVGIGTNAPAEILHIQKDGASNYATTTIRNANSTAVMNFGVGGSTVANAPLQNNAYLLNASASYLHLGTSDTPRLSINSAGAVFINDDANANTTIGLTINQGASDNEIFSLKSSDIAHGITDPTETDTFLYIKKHDAAAGGAEIAGFTEGTTAVRVAVVGTTENTTKSTAGRAAFQVDGYTKSGTSAVGMGADSNIAAIMTAGVTRFIFDAEGDSHQDVGTAWTNFDFADDAALLTDLSLAVSQPNDPIKERFHDFLKYNKEKLEKYKLVTFNDDGHHFVNMSKLSMLLTGAVRQSAEKISSLETRLESIERKLLN